MIPEEEEYKPFIENTVMPFLTRRLHKGEFKAFDGLKLYYEYYTVKNPRGAVVICHGFTECIQKYKEMIYYFLRRHYMVFAMDWRGHGYSGRQADNLHKVYVESFQHYITDLHNFITRIVIPNSPGLDRYLYAHSMGGAIGAAFLEQYPLTFKKAILNAPMIRMQTANVPEAAAFAIAALKHFTGHGKDFVLGQNQTIDNDRFETCAARSRARFEYHLQRRRNNELLQTSGSTYDWLYHNIIGTHQLTARRRCKKIITPLLILTSDHDTCVKNSGIHKFFRRLPGEKHLCLVKNSRHEIYSNDTKQSVGAYYKKVFQFFEG